MVLFMISLIILLSIDSDGLKIRLANSENSYSGRVEIYNPEFGWGTVCDDDWDRVSGDIVCRQLGFTGSNETLGVFYGEGTGPILLDEFYCTGAETHIWDCKLHDGWNNHDCDHSEDASLDCY